jgi:hypothetical protein
MKQPFAGFCAFFMMGVIVLKDSWMLREKEHKSSVAMTNKIV